MKKVLLVLILVTAAAIGLSAQRTITGKVTDPGKEPLIGATVLVEGTSIGTITDVSGEFSLNVPEGSNVLIISYTGYTARRIELGSSLNYDVELATDAVILSDVVVVAYGTATREKFTGSAARISSEQIANRPISNVAQAIVGASPGVQTNASSGQPGSAPAIRIRGFGSINASNDPLYVVDGVPFSANIANLNPDDIESISILKDAASTSLYGARAANGVVMITTKRGKAGKNQVNVKLARGFSDRAIAEYPKVDAFEYYPLMWEAYRNSLAYRATNPLTIDSASTLASRDVKGLVAYNPFNVPDNQIVGTDGRINSNAQLIYNAEDLDWESPITRQGLRDEMVVSFNGGQGKSDYFLSFSYLNDRAFLIRSDLERYTARLNFNNQVLDWLRTGINLAGTFVKSNFNSGADAAGTAFVNPFNFSRNIGPIYPVYAYDPANPGQYLLDGSGQRQFDFGNLSALGLPNRPGGGYGGRHIVAETQLNQEFFRRNVWNGRTYAEVTFLKNFKFTTNLAVDVTNRTDVDYDNAIIGDGAPGGRSQKEFSNVVSYNLNQLLNYTNNFGKHNVSFLLGHENYDYRDENLYGFRAQQILDGNTELVNFTTISSLTSQSNFYRVEGYFSRINYDFDDRYYLSLSYRADGSSKFEKDVRWGDFWSASGAWRLDQEKFIQNNDFINLLKLRASYGETGNDGGISFYAWQPRYTLGFNNATEAGIIQSSLGNPLLEWEANRAVDVALEFGLFKGKVSGSVEFFHRISDNLIFDVPLPVSAGILTQTRNVGSMFNQGWEVELNVTPVRNNDFSWSVGFNLTTLRNEITKMPDGQPEIISGTKKLAVGRSLYDYWLREWYGVDPADGAALYRANTFIEANTRITPAGDTLSISQNNARFHYNGSSIPDFYGGINTEIFYKGLSLRALLTYQIGGLVYDGPYAGLMSSGTYGGALHRDILTRWQKPGDVTNVPRMDASQTAIFGAASDRWLVDASFLNIRNITLSYDLPRNLVNKLRMQRLGVYVAGENLKMFSKRDGMNVEQSFTGVTSAAFIPARTFTTGINITL